MKCNLGNVGEESCNGCGACYQKCPKHCIQMVENDRGFLLPQIGDGCISCGLCVDVCPERKNTEFVNKVVEVWAAADIRDDILKESTSGGVFVLFAEQILSQNGVVFGCTWEDGFRVKHIKVTKIDALFNIQKSKYIQSNTADTFKEVQGLLQNGVPVLYSGTGCQIAGLRSYLGKNYDTLYAVEVACHGVPAPGLFAKYIVWLEAKYSIKIANYTFRNKVKHKKGEHYTFSFADQNGRKIYKYSNEDPFYASFLKGKTLRDTCYHCKYKNFNHTGDILLCDFWGIEKAHPSFDAKYGASAVLIYSDKGKRLFEEIPRKTIRKEKSQYEAVVASNSSVIKSADVGCRIQYSLKDSDVVERMIPPKSLKNFVKNHIPEWIKYSFIKKL